MSLLKLTVRAYAAGIIDGEGSIGTNWYPKKGHLQVRIRVGNTDPKMLLWLKAHFEGSVRPNKNLRPATYKPSWTWDLCGPRAESFLRAIKPFLITKLPAAETALALRALKCRHGRGGIPSEDRQARQALVLKLHQLNKRGVA